MATVGTPGAISAPPASAGHFGQGVKYPLEYDANTGRLKLSVGVKSVEDSIKSIVLTAPSERPMLPGYGANVGLFEPAPDVDRLIVAIQQNIADYEPRVSSCEVEVALGQSLGEVFVQVTYVLVDEANSRTLTVGYFEGASS
jgi:uncharacterized protein